MAGAPDLRRVEIELTSGVWTDISTYVRIVAGIGHKRGRANAFETCSAGTLNLTLDNPDGRFTPYSALIKDPTTGATSANPFYPNVLENKRIRIVVQHGNLIGNNSFESGVADWQAFAIGWDAGAPTQSLIYPVNLTHSMLLTTPASALGTTGALTLVNNLKVGQPYTFGISVRSDTGNPDWAPIAYGVAGGSTVTTKNTHTRGTVTFTPTLTSHYVGFQTASAYTAGKLLYADAAMLNVGSTAQTYRTDGITKILWTGYIDSLSMTFDGDVATWNRVVLSATDRSKLHNRRQLQGTHEEVARDAGVAAYYPLSTSGSDADTTEVTDKIRPNGVGKIYLPALNTAATYAWVSDGQGPTLPGGLQLGPGPSSPGLCPTVGVPALDLGSSTAYVYSVGYWWLDSGISQYLWEAATTQYVMQGQAFHGAASVSLASSVLTGKLNHFLGVWTRSAGTDSLSCFVNGVAVGSASAASDTYAPYTPLWFLGNKMTVPAFPYASPLKPIANGAQTTFSGLVLAAADLSGIVSDLYAAGINDLAGESAADHAERVLQWLGLSTDEYRIDDDMVAVMGAQSVNDRSGLDVLQEIGTIEYAPVYVAGDGVVEIQSRARRATLTPTWTFDADADLDGSNIVFTLADEGIVNQVVAQITGGASVTVYVDDVMSDVMTDSLSGAVLNPIQDSIEGAFYDVPAARDVASHRLLERYQARLRLAQVTIDPYTSANDIWVSVLSMEISDMMRLTGLPPSMTGGISQRDLWVESMDWAWTDSGITVTCDTTAVDRAFGQMALDDTDTSHLGHDAGVMTLSGAHTDSTTTIVIATTSGPTWTTDPAAYPLTIRTEEEEITLPNPPGGAVSPQTFTGALRHQNGTQAAAHAAGTLVDLYPVPCLAH